MGESNELFTQILSSGPSQSTLFLLLTEMKKQGQNDDVIRECVKALNVYPDDYRIRRLLAECYLDAGLIDQSEKELEKVTSHIEHLIPVYKIQAESYARQGKVKEAAEALKKYLYHRPDDKEALSIEDRIRPEQQKPIPKISETLGDIAEEDEDTELIAELATPTLAEIYYNQGLIQEAINTYKSILSADPGNEAAGKRIKELMALAEGEEDTPITGEDIIRERKKKMLGILEGWLARIQESSHAR
jgi:tetratricopeptide (TPR) repeat protein